MTNIKQIRHTYLAACMRFMGACVRLTDGSLAQVGRRAGNPASRWDGRWVDKYAGEWACETARHMASGRGRAMATALKHSTSATPLKTAQSLKPTSTHLTITRVTTKKYADLLEYGTNAV